MTDQARVDVPRRGISLAEHLVAGLGSPNTPDRHHDATRQPAPGSRLPRPERADRDDDVHCNSPPQGIAARDPAVKLRHVVDGIRTRDPHLGNVKRSVRLVRLVPTGGSLIVIENIIDDDRRENLFGLIMSLNMMIEFGDAFDFTGSDLTRWCNEVGFRKIELLPLASPASAGIAYK